MNKIFLKFSFVAMLATALFLFNPIFGQKNYKLVKDISQIQTGKKYLIVGKNASDNGNFYALGYQKASNRHGVKITMTGDSTSVTVASTPTDETSAYAITIKGTTGEWELHDDVNGTVLGPDATTNSNKLTPNTKGTPTYTIIFGNENNAVITCVGSQVNPDNRNIIRYNATKESGNLFSCYKSGQTNVWLYIENEKESTDPFVSVNKTNINFGPLKTETGYKKEMITITSGNLTSDLALSLKTSTFEDGPYWIDVETITQTQTSKTINVSFVPPTAGVFTDTLTISGGGITSDVKIVLSGTGVVQDNEASLMITEYSEAKDGNNKALELYNTADKEINLMGYVLKLSRNGTGFEASSSDLTCQYALSGTLPAHGFIVIYNSYATASAVAQIEANNPAKLISLPYTESQVASFNGDDAVGLFFDEILIDVIGDETNVDKDIWLENTTTRRLSTVTTANPTFTESEWVRVEEGDWSNFGKLTSNGSSNAKNNISNIVVYPNPLQNTLYINTTDIVSEIMIYNVQGRLVLSQKDKNNIDVQNLSSGSYIVKVRLGNGGEFLQKMVK